MNKKVILLLSGGFDSGVAGYLLQKQGYEIIPVHFSNLDFVGDWTIQKCKKIASKFNWPKLYILDIADFLQIFVNNCKHSYFFVLMKRLMLVLSSELVKQEEAKYIATGESLGQVSSQTLANIEVIENATDYRVLKPLIAMDKETIICYSKNIGIFDIASGPEVCDILGPKHPITFAHLDTAIVEEKKIDYETLVNKTLESMKIIDID